MTKPVLTLLLCLLGGVPPTLTVAQKQPPAPDAELLTLLQAFARTSAATGREQAAAQSIKTLFKAGALQQDRLGNVVLTVGSGTPRRLLTAPLDEPGYVVSQILPTGYLRVTPVGGGQVGPLYHQFLEGHDVQIQTERGTQYGISCVPSSHYDNLRTVPERSKAPFQWQEAFLDVGAPTAAAVARQGIQLLDPVTLYKKPVVLRQQWVAAPAMKTKAAAVALATVAQTLLAAPPRGTTVIAWTTLELLNGKGYEAVVTRNGPFDEVYRFNRYLESEAVDRGQVLADQPLTALTAPVAVVKPLRAFRNPAVPNANLARAKVYQLGLPAAYPNTPVEAVALPDVKLLAHAWLQAVECPVAMLRPPAPPVLPKSAAPATATSALLTELVGRYGVSTAEQPVRTFLLQQLPTWAKPLVDAKGNVVLTFGQGKQHLVFVAHMDEVGFVVDSVRADGRLVLTEKGGFFNWLWEAQPALLHLAAAPDLPAVFEPRAQYGQATKSALPAPLVAYAGFASAAEARAAGIQPGVTTATMPKQLLPLSNERAAARGFDDRVGCAALLLSLQHLDPTKLPFKVTCVWSTGEETGLVGSSFAAQSLQDAAVVYPIDTFVSSDAPQESPGFGYCPLGQGAVIRVLESINFVDRDLVRYVQALAEQHHIPIQQGMTAGGTDGLEFLTYGIPSVPISWPGRYSHSPVEVMDYRDLNSLVLLIQALMQDKHTY